MSAMPPDAPGACPRGLAVLSLEAHSGLPLVSAAAAGLAGRLPCAGKRKLENTRAHVKKSSRTPGQLQ